MVNEVVKMEVPNQRDDDPDDDDDIDHHYDDDDDDWDDDYDSGNPNYPSTTGNPSGGGRGNTPK
jgi:hypothetical protein